MQIGHTPPPIDEEQSHPVPSGDAASENRPDEDSDGTATPTQSTFKDSLASVDFMNSEAAPSHASTDAHSMSQDDLKRLHSPTPHQKVGIAVASGQNRDVTLWRGTTKKNADNIRNFGTAGGAFRKNENIHAPTKHEVLTQVAGGSLASGARASLKPTEYTANPNVARGFGSHGAIIAVKVNSKYLTAGSDTEAGWAVHEQAPVTFLGAAKGRFAGEGSEDHPVPDAG